MTTGSLRDTIRRRLDYLRAGGAEPAPFVVEHDFGGAVDGYGEDDDLQALLGADWQRLAPYVYRRVAIVPSPITARPRLLPASVPIERCGFFDTETTGLAGAGAVIFLFGIAAVRGDRMVVEQVFLGDFPGETSFLEHVEGLLAEHRLFVSFNGKSFDKTILTERFLLDGRSLDMPEHLDLLYPSRRLWASLTANCRLKTLEEAILGIDRGEDVDGFEVPDIYFEFLRSGELGRLPVVFDHNHRDVITLAQLLATIEQALSGDDAVPVDPHGVGHLLLGQGDRCGLDYLRRGYRDGRLTCGAALGGELKRSGEWREAVELWRDMAARHRDRGAAVELAKYYEHRAKDYDAALECVKPFFGGVRKGAGALDCDLLRRVARLRRKAGRRPAPQAACPRPPVAGPVSGSS